MNNGLPRVAIVSLLVVLLGVSVSAWAKMPEGFRDIKLGMHKEQVLETMQKSPSHISFDDNGGEIAEIIRGDDLFRFATYCFDSEGVLVKIVLQMREILGRDRCLEMFNNQHGLKVTPLNGSTTADLSVEVHDNTLVLKKVNTKDTRSAKAKGAS